MRTLIALVLAMFALLPATTGAQEAKQSFEGLLNKLLAPGPLIVGHDNLEHKDCLKCHEPAGGIPNQLCLDCHKEIRADIEQKAHYHGLMKGKPCIDCHADHKGRSFDPLKFNSKTFEHEKTGFVLDGAHQKTDCVKCHTEKRRQKPIRSTETRYLGTVNSCNKCHMKDDIHFFEGTFKNKECSNCHSTTEWKDVQRFDHQRESGYALVGKHADLKCSKCHVSEGKNNFKYDWPQLKTSKCLSCHKDQHGDKLSPKFRGGECATCHVQTSWKLPNFDHSVTSFALRGKHAQIQCAECHKQAGGTAGKSLGSFRWTGLKKSCNSCHADYHGYAGEKADRMSSPLQACESCHSDGLSWKQELRFDHNTQTDFPITGKHKDNRCFECHKPTQKAAAKTAPQNTPRLYNFPTLASKTCETCHKSPHSKAFHQKFKGVSCSSCHTTEGWKVMNLQSQINSDHSFHDKTRFPLTGKHKVTSCKGCHNSGEKEVYKFPNADKEFCVSCHATVHKRQFSEKTLDLSCAKCHTTQDFVKRPTFDHGVTAFALTGKHEKIAAKCAECHKPTREKLPTKPPKVMHQFNFDERRDPNFCSFCHASVHKEQFNPETQKKSCAECHGTASFAKLLDFDHDATRFKLTGKHAEIGKQCNECHKTGSITLATKPPKRGHIFMFEGVNRGFCEECHANEHKDMFHKEFFSKPCTSCHLTETFTKRKEFDHDDTDYELKGKHKQVKCAECHKPTQDRYKREPRNRKGDYAFPEIKTKNCQTCHRDVHKGANGPTCSKCHNENGWKNSGEFHRDFLLKGVHLQLDCKECHVNERILHGSSQECSTCHIKDDVHQGQLRMCQDCHTQNFWTQTTFDHTMTRFPLRGAHRVTECKACHNQGTYQGLPNDCRSCHIRDAAGVTAPDHSQPRYFRCDQCHTEYHFGGATGS